MSRPPTTIHIKRKATDDPVDVLRVHELNGKRQRRASEFVFTRQSADATLASHDGLASAHSRTDGTRPIKPLPRSGGQASLGPTPETGIDATTPSDKHGEGTQHVNNLTSQLVLNDDTEITALEFAQHRRFHISRTSASRGRESPVIGGKIQKRGPTVFIERRPRTPISREEKQPVQTEPRTTTITPDITEKAEVSPPQKKPGLAARTSQNASAQLAPALAPAAQNRNVRLPSGMVMPWDVTSEQLAQELQAYTLEEIGHNMAKSEKPEPTQAKSQPKPEYNGSMRVKKAVSSKFKPKVPALRYHERHPEEAAAAVKEAAAKEANAKEGDEAEVDGDFVIDTYHRMPAEEVQMDGTKDYGYIVLESQPDIDEFYEDSSDHSENEDYDEEDENAENHYSADYPDEEVDYDDEYGRNPYRYRTGNASDEEEFDENDYDEMEDVDDYSTRYPWLSSNQPSWMRDEDEMKDEDEDEDDEDENEKAQNEDEDKINKMKEDKDKNEKMKGGEDKVESTKGANDVEAVAFNAKPKAPVEAKK